MDSSIPRPPIKLIAHTDKTLPDVSVHLSSRQPHMHKNSHSIACKQTIVAKAGDITQTYISAEKRQCQLIETYPPLKCIKRGQLIHICKHCYAISAKWQWAKPWRQTASCDDSENLLYPTMHLLHAYIRVSIPTLRRRYMNRQTQCYYKQFN